MKKLSFLFLFSFCLLCYTQTGEKIVRKNTHVAYAEYTTWIIWNVTTINYEYCIVKKPGRIIAPRMGIGYFFGWEGKGPSLPISLNCIYGEKDLKFEFNAGVNLLYKANEYSTYVNNYVYTGEKGTLWSPLWALPIARVGFRYEINKLLVKGSVGVCGLGCSVGYNF